jgi:hypothetical protein
MLEQNKAKSTRSGLSLTSSMICVALDLSMIPLILVAKASARSLRRLAIELRA